MFTFCGYTEALCRFTKHLDSTKAYLWRFQQRSSERSPSVLSDDRRERWSCGKWARNSTAHQLGGRDDAANVDKIHNLAQKETNAACCSHIDTNLQQTRPCK